MDCDEEYSFTIVSFLRDIEWIEQEPSGKYVIIDKGLVKGDILINPDKGKKRRNATSLILKYL